MENIESKYTFSWRCPSNIAIVKYWGKKPNQIPCNSSVSMTLTHSFTETTLELLEKKTTEDIELDYFFENQKNSHFENRIQKYLAEQQNHFPFLKDYALRIHSKNSFPHSAGIASSASAFGALALNLLDATQEISGQNRKNFIQEASNLARLGSGSACRSLFPGFAVWGENKSIPTSSDVYATVVSDIHPNFQKMHDAILIVESEPKKVSSSAGHSLMKGHPYAETRFAQANERTSQLLEVLTNGDFERFIDITESEARKTLELFEFDFEKYNFVTTSSIIIEQARHLISKYGTQGLRTLDSIQLSTAVSIFGQAEIFFTADILLKSLFEAERLPTYLPGN